MSTTTNKKTTKNQKNKTTTATTATTTATTTSTTAPAPPAAVGITASAVTVKATGTPATPSSSTLEGSKSAKRKSSFLDKLTVEEASLFIEHARDDERPGTSAEASCSKARGKKDRPQHRSGSSLYRHTVTATSGSSHRTEGSHRSNSRHRSSRRFSFVTVRPWRQKATGSKESEAQETQIDVVAGSSAAQTAESTSGLPAEQPPPAETPAPASTLGHTATTTSAEHVPSTQELLSGLDLRRLELDKRNESELQLSDLDELHL
ncbi:PREDICTED: endochitinase A-like [Rhagoletis zephyria]|uniref:endochitinase A-like n=1 Tax=Rhagoletis zephyria TaxID=28612 RepID=UPI0008115C36|nr:PREDICTED: endochitinase A-like [Rhagoletis zephyria]